MNSVICANCQSTYSPPTWSKFFHISQKWYSEHGYEHTFIASLVEPGTEYIHCPFCYPKFLEREVEPTPSIYTRIVDVEDVINQERVRNAEFHRILKEMDLMDVDDDEELRLIRELYRMSISQPAH